MTTVHRRCATSLALAVAAASMAIVPQAMAQEAFPEDPVEFIVPWSPGGGSDTLMRLVANHAETYLGQPLPVINMPGVSGTTGLKELSRRDADGYTIGQVHEGLMVASHTGLTPLNYDDFEAVAAVTQSPQYLTVPGDAPYSTFDEFVDYAKQHPGEVRFGVTLGGVPHIHAAMMEEAEDLQFRYVGFEGTGPRIRALVGGHIDAAIGDISSSGEFVKNGDLRFLAVGSEERQPEAPDVPTFAELGHPELKLNIIRGILAPKGTPEERIDVLAAAFESMSQDEAFAQAVHNAGASVVFEGPDAFAEYLETSDATIERLSGKLAR
ncbi:tripartite tricarboxylate transporter substrate binding protein [Halomonas denitrificans]|uniref:Bug family tripartite tricarboxylate transporter substrate binding protein n=1 Tax=Halomonas TaxID=2745 RepID=UPI001A8D0776|nr:MULTISPECIES: tripartite tricarboxylate transporter substrate binding protein [Halomonas]MED5296214.1 tripartite tricarboxylate transporter substrate binding protein [Pseudomonadota bacterium]MBN8410629.1 tripartite tricarboxylate transporter substrate binding protein [Halomonas litopenaei]MBY5925733.1 tripartite tricarboxylate transporter substrate binding protein [Halomonas sp. DP4Y7-2]MBY5930720.1 tripartite tricarboxylate transporter substrate binding protein [Halomonas sp. DP8Y7-3]MBY5